MFFVGQCFYIGCSGVARSQIWELIHLIMTRAVAMCFTAFLASNFTNAVHWPLAFRLGKRTLSSAASCHSLHWMADFNYSFVDSPSMFQFHFWIWAQDIWRNLLSPLRLPAVEWTPLSLLPCQDLDQASLLWSSSALWSGRHRHYPQQSPLYLIFLQCAILEDFFIGNLPRIPRAHCVVYVIVYSF